MDEIPLKWIGELVKFVSYESDDVLRLKRYREELKEKKNRRNAVPDKETDKENKGNAQNDIAPVPLPLTEEEKKIAAIFSSDNASPAPGKELGKLSLMIFPAWINAVLKKTLRAPGRFHTKRRQRKISLIRIRKRSLSMSLTSTRRMSFSQISPTRRDDPINQTAFSTQKKE